MRRASFAVLPVVALAAALSLTGCAPAAHVTHGPEKITTTQPPAPDASSTAPTPSPTSNAAGPAPTSTSDPSTTRSAKHTKPAPPVCDASKLTINYVPVDHTAGQTHAVLMFSNRTSAACETTGNPAVWFSSSTGVKAGPQAKNDTSIPATLITLQPGQSATAMLTISDADIIGSCTVESESYLLVAPKGVDNSAIISIPAIDACSNAPTLTIGVETSH